MHTEIPWHQALPVCDGIFLLFWLQSYSCCCMTESLHNCRVIVLHGLQFGLSVILRQWQKLEEAAKPRLKACYGLDLR